MSEREHVQALWARERIRDGLLREQAKLAKTIQEKASRVEAIRAEILEEEQGLEQLRVVERELQRKVEQYSTRRKQTRSIIDQGLVSDFETVQQQLRQIEEILDEAETEAFEQMERVEAAQDALEGKRRVEQHRLLELKQARSTQEERTPGLEAELQVATQDRDEARALLPIPSGSTYDALRARGKRAAAILNGELCTGCRTRVHNALLMERMRFPERAINCPQCGCFLIDA